jgi:hypothetical protein
MKGKKRRGLKLSPISSTTLPSIASSTHRAFGIADEPRLDGVEAFRHQMIPKHFFYKVFFGLAFHVDEQSRH